MGLVRRGGARAEAGIGAGAANQGRAAALETTPALWEKKGGVLGAGGGHSRGLVVLDVISPRSPEMGR